MWGPAIWPVVTNSPNTADHPLHPAPRQFHPLHKWDRHPHPALVPTIVLTFTPPLVIHYSCTLDSRDTVACRPTIKTVSEIGGGVAAAVAAVTVLEDVDVESPTPRAPPAQGV